MRNEPNSTSSVFRSIGPAACLSSVARVTGVIVVLMVAVSGPRFASAQFHGSSNQATVKVLTNSESTGSVEDTKLLDGSVENIKHVISKFGFQFNVSFEQIRYHAEIQSIDVLHRDADKIHVRVLLKQLQLTVDRTKINGKRHHALCGPFAIQIGTKRNVEINFLFQMDGEDSFQLIDSQFNLDRNNWTIARPQSIQVRGFGMTQNRVAIELKNGLNSNVGIVETKVLDQLPAAYKSIAERIGQVIKASKIAADRPASDRTSVNAAK